MENSPLGCSTECTFPVVGNTARPWATVPGKTQAVATEWMGWNRTGAEYVELRKLPENHDIVDPRNPLARTGAVYPALLEALLA